MKTLGELIWDENPMEIDNIVMAIKMCLSTLI